MKHPLLIFLSGLLLAGLAPVWWFARQDDEERLPDEKRAAMILLEKEQSGPGYFHPDDSAATPDEQGVFWLTPAQATAQIDGVAQERKMDESGKEKLMKLIKEACEPHPSRTVGGDRINVARLNVALDAIK